VRRTRRGPARNASPSRVSLGLLGRFDEMPTLGVLRPSPALQEAVKEGQSGEEANPEGDFPQHRDRPKAAKQRKEEGHNDASEHDARSPLSEAHVLVIYALRREPLHPRHACLCARTSASRSGRGLNRRYILPGEPPGGCFCSPHFSCVAIFSADFSARCSRHFRIFSRRIASIEPQYIPRVVLPFR
jgi:hypothetical protein